MKKQINILTCLSDKHNATALNPKPSNRERPSGRLASAWSEGGRFIYQKAMALFCTLHAWPSG